MKRSFLLLACAAAAQPVSESDAYPMIEYWQASDYRPNPLCESSVGPIEAASSWPFRKSLGLKSLATRLREVYRREARRGKGDVVFEANQRRVKTDFDTLATLAVLKGTAELRTGRTSVATSSGIAAKLCEAVATGPVPAAPPAWPTGVAAKRADVESFCNLMRGAAQATYCQDNYQYEEPEVVLARDLSGDAAQMPDPPVEAACLAPVTSLADPLDLTIQQYRQTPESLDWALVNQNEKKVYYLLWRSIEAVERYAERKLLEAQTGVAAGAAGGAPARSRANSIHAMFTNDEVFRHVLPEWRVTRLIYTNEVSASTNLRLPVATVAKRGAANMLVSIRRPLTTYESRLPLYNQLSFKYLYNFTGQLHDGASTQFQSLLSPVLHEVTAMLNAAPAAGAAGPRAKVMLTAADLPGVGAAAAIGNHISRLFGTALQVDVVLFGTPFFADRDMMESLRNNVEMRVIAVEGDSSDLVSCPQTISCDHNDLIIRTGIDSGVVYSYAQAHGYIKIPRAALAKLDAVWGEEASFLELAALRECAYPCALAVAACGADADPAKTGSAFCYRESCAAFT